MSAVPVWDPVVRLVHWGVAAAVVLNYWVLEAGEAWHERVGWAAAALVGIRLVWGFVGTRYARFAEFAPTPARLRAELRHLRAGNRSRPLGHTPIAAVGMFAFWFFVLLLAATGWMLSWDRYFGEAWIEDLHLWTGRSLVATAALHVLAVGFESWRARENLPWAMITGKKRAR